MTPAEKCKLFIAELEKLCKQFGYPEIVFCVSDKSVLVPGFYHDPENPGTNDEMMAVVFATLVDAIKKKFLTGNPVFHSSEKGKWTTKN